MADFDLFLGTKFQPAHLVELLRWRATHQGDRVGYTFLTDKDLDSADGTPTGTEVTYGEVDRKARAIAARLQSLGVCGERILLLYPSGLDYIYGFFGCQYAGSTAVPVYPPQTQQAMQNLQNIARDAEAKLILTTSAFHAMLAPLLAAAVELQNLQWLYTDAVAEGSEDVWAEPDLNSESLALLQYTSGTTGLPKGVMLTHGNIFHNCRLIAHAYEHTSATRVLTWIPTYHNSGLFGAIIQPLYGAYASVVMSPVSFLQSPPRWLRAIGRYRATVSGGPNFAYDLCVRYATPALLESLDFSTWDTAFTGAEHIRLESLDRFADTFACCGFNRDAFYSAYGLTESSLMVSGGPPFTPLVTIRVLNSGLENNRVVETSPEDAHARALVSCGQILPNQEALIVNPETLTRCEPDQIGELWLASGSVSQGYWKRPAETDATFHAYLADTGTGPFLRTGDLGFIADNHLFITGRLKDLIIIRGRNHYPQDIEATVAQAHPVVKAGGAVFSVEVGTQERLVVVQEVADGDADDYDAVLEAIRESVSQQHGIQVYAALLVKEGSIPKTASNKVQRHACRVGFLNGSLRHLRAWRSDYDAPEDALPGAQVENPDRVEDVAAWLVNWVAARTGAERSRVDVRQSVAGYGLDSLTAIELTHLLESQLGVSLPMWSLLQGTSIGELAAQIVGLRQQKVSAAPPVVPVTEREAGEYPLSYGQRSLWFLHQMAPDSPSYNVAGVVRICAALDVPALRRSFEKLVERHASLRTTFHAAHGVPSQRVHERMALAFAEEDAATWSEEELNQRLVELAHRPFDLAAGPLLRLWLFKRSAEEHILLSVVHHIVNDLWSASVLLDELGALYSAERSGAAALLPPITLRYTDFVYWQEQMLNSAEGERLWQYWREHLGSKPDVLHLPTDKPRPPRQTFRGASHAFRLDEELTRQLKALGQQHGATLFMTLLAAFHALLHRYTGQSEIAVGSPTAGRTRRELARSVGYHVNPLVLRADFSERPSFLSLLAQVRQTVLEAFAHQDYPFALLVERLQPERDPSRSPLFQAMFVLQKSFLLDEEGLSAFALGEAGARMRLGELTLESHALEQRIAQFDLTLSMAEMGNVLGISFEFNTDLFEPQTIERMSAHFRALLQAIVAQPAREIAALPMLADEERQQLLGAWSRSADGPPTPAPIHELFEAQAARTPEAVALVCADETLTYGELNRRANQLARRLRAAGIGTEAVVGILMERSPEMLVGLLAVLKSGGAYLPLDPAYPVERLRFILDETRVCVLLTQPHLRGRLAGTNVAQVLDVDLAGDVFDGEPTDDLHVQVNAENLAYIIYTSGSTGRPKGVMVNQRSLVNFTEAARAAYELQPRDRVLQFASLSFDTAAEEIYPCLTSGGTLVLRDDVMLSSATSFLRQSGQWGVTVLDLPTAYWHELTAQLDGEAVELPRSLRLVIIGGEKASARQLSLWAKHVGPEVHLLNTYGPTETTVVATMCDVSALPGADGRLPEVPLGRPIRNVQVYVLDANLHPVLVGVPGEFYIGGAGVARGYLNRPGLTAERFLPDPFSTEPGSRLYRTGDIVRYLSDGNIEFRGRADSQVKLRGFRIELGEIEAALSRQPGVRECIVVASADERGEKRLVAYVVTTTTTSELRAGLKRELPDYMVPAAFVKLDSLPLTVSGKIDRRALPAPDGRQTELAGVFVAPRTPIEEALVGIWQQVLGLRQVGAEDNFFELGGHSLLATQLIARVREGFAVELPLRAVFDSPTVALLARAVEEALKTRAGVLPPPLKPRPRGEAIPLSFAQQRLWFLQELAPASNTYNMPGAVQLRGPLDIAELEANINRIVERHEALRTTFAVADEQPVQVIHPSRRVKLPVLDMSTWPEAGREAELQRLLVEEAERPFDLTEGPLLRLNLLKLEADDFVLQVTMHHIISDGWSVGVFIRELTALSEASARGDEPSLTPLPVQYADYAAWQREWLRAEVLDAQLAYWKEQLKESPPLLSLPTDRPRPAVQTFRGATESFTLAPELLEAFRALSRREGVTLFMALLAAFEVLLSRYTGQTDLCVGTSAAGRAQREVEGLIGFFVNTLVLRGDLSGDPTFVELLRRTRETTLAAYAHQDLPFEKLVEELQPERNLSHSPLFQVMFVMQSTPSAALEMPGLTLTPLDVSMTTAKFDLTLMMEETPQGLKGLLEYNTDLFDAATVARMSGHFETLMRGIVADAAQPISKLPLLREQELRRMLVEWNETVAQYDAACVHEMFQAQAARTPDALAVSFEDEQLSYEELNRRANQLAHRLRALGVGAESRVAILMERSVEMVTAVWGVLKAGAAYVPLDPKYPRELLDYMLTDAQASVVLTQQRLAELRPSAEGVRVLSLDTERQSLERESGENPIRKTTAENLAYVIYTSGSTGRPKGVMITHGGLANYLNWALRAYDVTAGGNAPVHSPLGFDLTVTSLFLPLLAGRSVALLPEEDSIEALADALRTDESTLFKLTPTHLQALSQLLPQAGPVITGEKVLVIGGEALSWQTVSFWTEQGVRLINEYGPTETVVGCCTYEITSRGDAPGRSVGALPTDGAAPSSWPDVPIGRPIANTRLYILDEHQRPVPVGVAGELYVSGAGVARGYLNRPDLTAERFLPDPFQSRDGERMYRTGDRARYLPGGDIEFLGRADDQLKVRGFRIEAGEVEAALLRHAAVREAVVVAREDVAGDKRLVAYVVAAPGATPTGEELRRHAVEHLPAHMIPAAIVQLDMLPLTVNGKVNRRALPVPEYGQAGGRAEYVRPRTATEEMLADIWRELLKIERVSVADNFFDLGGHSLLATRMVSRVRAAMQVELPLRTVFEHPTIAEMAQDIDALRWLREDWEDSSVLSQGQREFGEL